MNDAKLLELREKILQSVRKNSFPFRILLRFLLSAALMVVMDSRVGFNTTLAEPLVGAIIVLICTLLPVNLIAAVMAAVFLVHLYALSLEAMLVGLVLVLLCLLLYFRFSPEHSALLLLVPVCSMLNLQYALPIVAGLLFGPAAAAPISLGLLFTGYGDFIRLNRTTLAKTGTADETLRNFRFLVDGVIGNERVWVMILAFLAALVLVWVIRRRAIAHAWTVAMAAGAVAELLIILGADMILSLPLNIPLTFLGVVLAVLIGSVVRFFCFNLDYTRVEVVQFDDDDYYYYVRAVPKAAVRERVRTVTEFTPAQTPPQPEAQEEQQTSDRQE